MNRADVVKGLEAGLVAHEVAGTPLGPSLSETLRAAVDLLGIPTTAEIEAAREHIFASAHPPTALREPQDGGRCPGTNHVGLPCDLPAGHTGNHRNGTASTGGRTTYYWPSEPQDGERATLIGIGDVCGKPAPVYAPPAPPPERFWRVHLETGAYLGAPEMYFACACGRDGMLIEAIGRNQLIEADAEADGRASGLPEWKP